SIFICFPLFSRIISSPFSCLYYTTSSFLFPQKNKVHWFIVDFVSSLRPDSPGFFFLLGCVFFVFFLGLFLIVFDRF
ncbi:MAG: hypothetical protein IJL52_07570, partial [Clostridia bacterium]|nr:hypothetical protein [Clostridia bacterium]